ncbi:restriction endonuclease subunit S [Flavobacterium psychrophilum]|uniref:restriction endonuclease subunit S n=1 Tax=Flavobacterium psychrophilum TaxID=96345 RepID=UPI0004F5B005|nr:restriction endonuclease subunit S [Flavobacterium psychrophilum]AIN73759.1 type I R-M system specificity subunit [Flavobacterium psychrophilum FPG3]EKT2069077.1 restriction endonuclease subunit S [Flavobacterium psychrophilum]EKT2071175.1 restriction endonuclease subunit S [Flavobacterium psychrophilum]EKT4490695.1 restriction endonuclease subunit S [Flavobacterium psychrophilum]MBF2044125.1 restriction endonuclease subunit S [Flavobacterium psychrophilum]
METLQPKLRFPEFNGNWDDFILGKIAKFSKGKGISKSDISKNGKFECIRYGELYTVYGETISKIVSKTDLDSKDLIFSSYNDIIIPASGETQLDIATASCVLKDGVALGGDLNIIKTDNNGVFLSYYLNNSKKEDIASLAQGVSVVHLYSSQLSTLNINLPSLEEQTKIANFLSSIDEKLNLLKEKKALLEDYKKGMMQKIFNQEIRFKDDNGNDFEDWEEMSLGSMCKITTGKLDANAMVEDGEYRFYTCAKDYYRIDKYAFDTEALLISGNGANVGYIHYYRGKFNAYQRTYILDGFEENITYVKFYLQMFLPKRVKGEKNDGNTPYIVLSTLSEMEFLIPSKAEQTKIANFLSAIDKKIELVSNQIQDTQEYKKGLLQQMFV